MGNNKFASFQVKNFLYENLDHGRGFRRCGCWAKRRHTPMGAGAIFDRSVISRKPFECSYEDWPKPELVCPTVDLIFRNSDNINSIFVPVARA